MIKYTIDSIETLVQDSQNISEERRASLLALIAQLREELELLSDTEQEEAASLAGFAEVSAREHLRPKQNKVLKELSVRGLKNSLDSFKVTHPDLVAVIDKFLTSLSNLGI